MELRKVTARQCKRTDVLWNFAARETVALGTVGLNNETMQNQCKTSCPEFLVLQEKEGALSMESQLKPADMWTPRMELGSMKALNSGWLKLNIHIN
jgi:hypothetical protein